LYSQSVDVLYLNNGGAIRGSLLEMDPTNGAKIQTSDGSIFVYPMSDVDHVSKDETIKTANVSVRYSAPERQIARHKGDLLWKDTGVKLKEIEYSDILYDNYWTYKSARKQFNTGRAFMTVGIVFSAAASVLLMSYASSFEEDARGNRVGDKLLRNSSSICVGIANIGIGLGCVFKGIGKNRIEWAKDVYNTGRSFPATINFAPSMMMNSQRELGVGGSVSISF